MTEQLIPRILRDIDNGVLALDLHGRIIYMNPQCRQLLGLSQDLSGCSYAESFFQGPQARENDAFHQFILDAVYQKDATHRGNVPFVCADGTGRSLRIVSSFLKSEDGTEKLGIIAVISDVTQTQQLKRKRRDASVVFASVTACVCLYLLLLGALDFFALPVPTKVLTHVINAMVAVAALIIYRKTDFSREELGLGLPQPRATLVPALLISAAITALLILLKLLLLPRLPGLFPAGAPFWNWQLGPYAWISYIFTCILQEFLARSMIHGSIRKLFDGPRGAAAAIALSSLLFGAVHIAHGFLYMASAVVLLGSLGVLYEKQRSIWGVALIHYVLGQAACCLGFLT